MSISFFSPLKNVEDETINKMQKLQENLKGVNDTKIESVKREFIAITENYYSKVSEKPSSQFQKLEKEIRDILFPSPISLLIDDIYMKIFTYLGIKDLFSLTLTSRKMKPLADLGALSLVKTTDQELAKKDQVSTREVWNYFRANYESWKSETDPLNTYKKFFLFKIIFPCPKSVKIFLTAPWVHVHRTLEQKKRLRKEEEQLKADYQAFYDAAHLGDLEKIESLLAEGRVLTHGKKDQDSPLHIAASEGHLNIVKCLVRQGLFVDPIGAKKCTPFWLACREGNLEIAEFLIAWGADIKTEKLGKESIDKSLLSLINLFLGKFDFLNFLSKKERDFLFKQARNKDKLITDLANEMISHTIQTGLSNYFNN